MSQKIVQQDFFSDQKDLVEIEFKNSVERRFRKLFMQANELEAFFFKLEDRIKKLEEKSP